MTTLIRPHFVSIDVETTMNGNEDVGLSHPMHPDNKVVCFGMGTDEGAMTTYDVDLFERMSHGNSPSVVYCGHNISFDLLYIYRAHKTLKGHYQFHTIWDTQLAEYIITGQKSKFSSLDELSVKYGLPLKDDKIKKYFEAGMGADKIPEDELVPYLRQDVLNTLAIAHKQWEVARQQNQLNLIYSQMEALHATTEMMFNGLHIDQKTLDAYTVEVVNEFVEVKLALEEAVAGEVDDINSPKQWSRLFFGGIKKIRVKEEVGIYKNGNKKFKLMDKEINVPAMVAYKPDPDKVSDKTGQVSVDEDVLKDMLKVTIDPKATKIIEALLKYRELSKQLSTYVQGLAKHVIGNKIHGKLNHTSTVTGRLSSTNPNLQNISNNPIKKIFTSRFDGGCIVEVDFGQLEVAALAHVTKDKQLISDISNGVDIHSALYESMFHRKPTKEERKPFKARTFQLIYGAGVKAIAKQAGCSIDEAKLFVDTFYARYPFVKVWHDLFSHEANLCAKYLEDKDGLMEKARTFDFQTETGRIFSFKEYYSDVHWSIRTYNFSPTELKNWPVQGLATGDIVPHMVGVLFRKFVGREGVLMVNTIHDSIMFDVRQDLVADTILEVLDTLRDTHKYFEEQFKTPLALKLNASANYGTNWYDMIEAQA